MIYRTTAAVFAGLSSYPLALLGAMLVGLLESFGSFSVR